jgi:hypothetical protein
MFVILSPNIDDVIVVFKSYGKLKMFLVGFHSR